MEFYSQKIAVEEVPSVKVVCIGDCGVGKSSLMKLLASKYISKSQVFEENYFPTVGANYTTLFYKHPRFGVFFVDCYDIGGNPNYAKTRKIFFEDDGINCVDGVIFMW